MRNLLFFLIVLIGVYYLRRLLAGESRDEQAPTPTPTPQSDAEHVVPCAHCGLLVPVSEGVKTEGQFFCSHEHAKLGHGN